MAGTQRKTSSATATRQTDEYDALLAAAGLRRIAFRTSNSPQGVIEAAA